MSARILLYPSMGDSPTLFVNIITPLTHKPRIFQMLVDTGAFRTCLPADRAEFLGHNNHKDGVKTVEVRGIGGKSRAFIHTLEIELIDPEGGIWSQLISPWKSGVMSVLFVEKMETQTGILGRNILSQWERVGFRATPRAPHSAWKIEIKL